MNNKSLLKLISSNINIKQSSTILPSINISNDKYRQTAYIRYANVENITSSKNTIEARYNLDVQKCVYYYPKQISCSCGKSIQLRTINPTYQILSNDMIVNNFLESSTCNDCENLITKG